MKKIKKEASRFLKLNFLLLPIVNSESDKQI